MHINEIYIYFFFTLKFENNNGHENIICKYFNKVNKKTEENDYYFLLPFSNKLK